jgi:hypothetical protein
VSEIFGFLRKVAANTGKTEDNKEEKKNDNKNKFSSQQL